MAIENFKKFKEPMKTHIEYFCCDDRQFAPEDSEVVLYSWNVWKDVRDNPTSDLERDFIARKPIVEGEDEIVYFGKVKINDKWEKHLLARMEVPYQMGYESVVFWEVRPKEEYVWFELDKEGKRVSDEPKEETWWPTLEGIGATIYEWNGVEINGDWQNLEELIKYSREEKLCPPFDHDKKAFQQAMRGWLKVYGHPYMTIGRPSKNNKQKTTSDKVNL